MWMKECIINNHSFVRDAKITMVTWSNEDLAGKGISRLDVLYPNFHFLFPFFSVELTEVEL